MKRFAFLLAVLAFAFSLFAGAEIISEKPVLTYDKYDIDNNGKFDEMVYEISTKEQLYWFANAVNNGQGHINAVLVNDITVNENLLSKLTVDSEDFSAVVNDGESLETWNCTGSFSGIFDGRGHTVYGLYYNNGTDSASPSGFFARIQVAEVKNLNIKDSYFHSFEKPVGGIAAESTSSDIVNCSFDGYCRVTGQDVVGGIVGSTNWTEIRYCTNYGNVYGYGNVYNPEGGIAGRINSECLVTNCHNEGKIVGSGGYVGGIVGFNYGTVEYCYNKGEIVSDGGSSGICTVHYKGHVNNCYNVGVDKRGIGGYTTIEDENGYVDNCYWLESASSSGYRGDPAGQSEGRTEQQMKSLAFISELSDGKNGIWQQTEGEYPTLIPLEMSPLSINDNATTDTTSHIYSVTDGVVTIAADDAGVSFTIIFSDYDGKKQNAVDIVPFSSEKAATKYTVSSTLSLSAGDKIIVLANTQSLSPVCKEYIFE